MKSKTLTFALGIVLLAALATPFSLAAQQTRYKLIDIGTLGADEPAFTEEQKIAFMQHAKSH
jgi:hypothetical protein